VFQQKKLSKKILLVLLVLSFFSTFVCLNYNAPQFFETKPFFWIFISDNSLYPALLVLILEYLLFNKNPPEIFKSACFAGLLKYSVFSITLILFYSRYYFSEMLSAFYTIFFLTNAFLIFMAVFIFKYTHTSPASSVLLALWFLFNDYIDFGFNFKPYMPDNSYLILFALENVALSIATALALLFRPKPEV
jgi:uncharacterized membrane protein YpjA